MLLINCPYCGQRPELEFHNGGEAHVARPANPSELDDQAWAEFLFHRSNPKGEHSERWVHLHGCGRWFNAVRDTLSDDFVTTYAIDAPRPGRGAKP